jgi:hypothetical protein
VSQVQDALFGRLWIIHWKESDCGVNSRCHYEICLEVLRKPTEQAMIVGVLDEIRTRGFPNLADRWVC